MTLTEIQALIDDEIRVAVARAYEVEASNSDPEP